MPSTTVGKADSQAVGADDPVKRCAAAFEVGEQSDAARQGGKEGRGNRAEAGIFEGRGEGICLETGGERYSVKGADAAPERFVATVTGTDVPGYKEGIGIR